MSKLTFNQICRRAGGRRRYNFQRETAKRERRERVGELLKHCENKRGMQVKLARELGVSEATISRDCAFIKWLDKFDELFPVPEEIDLPTDTTDSLIDLLTCSLDLPN